MDQSDGWRSPLHRGKAGVRPFLAGSVTELRSVVWPRFESAVANAALAVAVVVAVAILMLLMGWAADAALDRLLG